MSNNILLRDYLKLQISKLADTNVEEGKIKSEALILHYLNISKEELYLDDIKVLDKDIKVMDNMFFELSQQKPCRII